MDIPPLISRSPPPIGSEIEEEDDDSDLPTFPTLNLSDQDTPKKSFDGLEKDNIAFHKDPLYNTAEKRAENLTSLHSESTSSFPAKSEDLDLKLNDLETINPISENSVNDTSFTFFIPSNDKEYLNSKIATEIIEDVNSDSSCFQKTSEVIQSFVETPTSLYEDDPPTEDNLTSKNDSTTVINPTTESVIDLDTKITSFYEKPIDNCIDSVIDIDLCESVISEESEVVNAFKNCNVQKSYPLTLPENNEHIAQESSSCQISNVIIECDNSDLKKIDFENDNDKVSNNSFNKETENDTQQHFNFMPGNTLKPDSNNASNDKTQSEFQATFPDIVENYQIDECVSDDEFSDFVDGLQEPCELSVKNTITSFDEVFKDHIIENQYAPILILSLTDELRKSIVWKKLSSLEHTPALNYRWGNSCSCSRLLSSLQIDSRNILSGNWSKTSSRKLSSNELKTNSEPVDSYFEINFNKIPVSHSQFEWASGGVTKAPLDDSSCSRGRKLNPTMISKEAEIVLSSFPDLSYLKQNFIVFPKNIF